jgi:AcrR family transcriptional regulator
MPRIDAPTIAEHRDQRRTALLAAGHELVLSGGPRAVTMTAVAASAGLSRTAVYEYFASTEDLLAAVLGERMTAWTTEVEGALATAENPQEKISTYVRVSLELIKDGSHGLLVMLSAETLPTHVRRQLSELHATLAAPLSSAVRDLGVPDVDLATRYVQGVVEAAARRIEPGQDIFAETTAATTFVIAGLQALAQGT